MTKKKNLIFFLLLFILANCSFDSKTGIWETSEDEKRRVLELEQKQNELISTEKIYSSENIFTKEKILSDKINLSKPKKNSSWAMSALNHQNFIGNNFITGTDNIFLKKKIGKNKFSLSKIMTSPLIYEDNIIIADSNGTIFNISLNGQVNWK